MSIVAYNMKEIHNKEHIDQSDYMYVWNNFINYNSGDIENFGETDLATVLKCLDKANFKATSMIFAASWERSILLDEDFIDFVRKYEEKILKPISNPTDLTVEIKRMEHISLIFATACNIGTQISMYALSQPKDKDFTNDELYTYSDIYKLFQYSMVEFLADINKGTAAQQLQCLQSIDKLMDEYPEQRVALSKLCGFKEPSTFINMVVKAVGEVKEQELEHIKDILHNLNAYVYARDLEKELAHNEPISNRRLKV
jgi:hypothetical protein